MFSVEKTNLSVNSFFSVFFLEGIYCNFIATSIGPNSENDLLMVHINNIQCKSNVYFKNFFFHFLCFMCVIVQNYLSIEKITVTTFIWKVSQLNKHNNRFPMLFFFSFDGNLGTYFVIQRNTHLIAKKMLTRWCGFYRTSTGKFPVNRHRTVTRDCTQKKNWPQNDILLICVYPLKRILGTNREDAS